MTVYGNTVTLATKNATVWIATTVWQRAKHLLTLWKTQRLIFSELSSHHSFRFAHVCTYSTKKSTKAYFLPKFFWNRPQNTRRKYWGKKFPLGLPWEILLHIPIYTHTYLHIFSCEFYSNLKPLLQQESLYENQPLCVAGLEGRACTQGVVRGKR